MANYENNDKPQKIPSQVEFNLWGDEPTETSWVYTREDFCKKIQAEVQKMVGTVEAVKLIWYKNDDITEYDPKSKQNKPVQKVVAEVWISEDVACIDTSKENTGKDGKVNPFMADVKISKFSDKMKGFIDKFCSDRDKDVYKNPSSKFAARVGNRRFYCIMVDLQKLVDIIWDYRGTGYKAKWNISGNISGKTSLDVSFVWNDKYNKNKGIKLIKITKAFVANDKRDLENRDPWISSKRKKKHHDD